MQIYLISLVRFPNNRSFGMSMTLYSCITPIVQMSRKRYYLSADLKLVVSDCCLYQSMFALELVLLISDCCFLQHQITSHFYATVSYKLNACITKPYSARIPSMNPKQSDISPLNGEVLYNLRKMLVSTQRKEFL